MNETFAQYLINKTLKPYKISVNKPVDSKYLKDILSEVFRSYPDHYDEVVTKLKSLGDKFSTWESISFGLDEIEPDYKKRDAIIKKYRPSIDGSKSEETKLNNLVKMQTELLDLNIDRDDDATLMVESAMSGKAGQLSKIRTAPLFRDKDGVLVPEVIDKSYAEGLNPYQSWLNAVESRKNISDGQLSVSEPGVVSKVFSTILADMVVSTEDCGTTNGLEFNTKDEAILDRYLAQPTKSYKHNTLIDSKVQQQLLRDRVDKVIVRSPQTCEASHNTVCSKCYGLSIAHGKEHKIGDNIGLITAGNVTEPATQMALSSKHAITTAKKQEGLYGIKGLTTVTDLPKIYPDRQILCEVYGEVFRIMPAPQGGKLITLRELRPVPAKYIVNAQPHPQLIRHWIYYIPPIRKILVKVKDKLYPGQPLTDGNQNIQDTARLRGIGVARSQMVENLKGVYQNTGVKLDRRHYEMLGRAIINYVKIEKLPPGIQEFVRGEIVDYNKFKSVIKKYNGTFMPLDKVLGLTLGEDLNHYNIGTIIDESVVQAFKDAGKKTIKVYADVEISPHIGPLPQVVLKRDSWVSNLAHRYLKDTIEDAATMGKKESIHGYNPISAYAYGAEFGSKEGGKY